MLGIQAARSLCTLILTSVSFASTASQVECDRPEFITRADIMGLGMAEVRGPNIDVSLFGYAKAPTRCITNDTVFEAASLTKPVVAYLVMRLADQGRIDLEDVLVERLPGLPLPDDDPRSKEVTVAMALAHMTGLDGADDQELRFVSEPGETFRYYPAGYRLVQRIIENIEGDSLEVVARREVFEPLGMASTSMVFREDLLDRIATRHRMLGDALERTRDPAHPPNAAASLITTPKDYGRFLREVMSGRGITEGARRSMLTPRITVPDTDGRVAWGIGWGLEPGRGTFFHYGDDGAAKSFVIGSLQADRAITYFANSYYGMSIAGEISERLLPEESPAVAWLGYLAWDAPMRLARRDALRAFVEGDADLGMQTFRRYEREYPDLDMNKVAAFLQWVLEGRSKHDGRARIIAWQTEREPANAGHYFNLAQSLRAMGELVSAIDALRAARPLSEESVRSWIDAQISWMEDDLVAADLDGEKPDTDSTLLHGSYETWRVFGASENLMFQAGEGRTYTLNWMHDNLYAIEEIDWFRLRFVIENGKPSRLIGLYSDGRTDISERTGDPG